MLAQRASALVGELRAHELDGGLLQVELGSGVLTEVSQCELGVVGDSAGDGSKLVSEQLEQSRLACVT